MAFNPHTIREAEWASYYRIASTDSLYPPITAQLTHAQEFAGTTVTENEITSRFAVIVEDYRAFSDTSSTASTSVTTSVQVLAENTSRKGYRVVNTGAASVYLLEGAGTASSANQTATIAAGGNYTSENPTWAGAVQVVSSTGTNVIAVTEYT